MGNVRTGRAKEALGVRYTQYLRLASHRREQQAGYLSPVRQAAYFTEVDRCFITSAET